MRLNFRVAVIKNNVSFFCLVFAVMAIFPRLDQPLFLIFYTNCIKFLSSLFPFVTRLKKVEIAEFATANIYSTYITSTITLFLFLNFPYSQ